MLTNFWLENNTGRNGKPTVKQSNKIRSSKDALIKNTEVAIATGEHDGEYYLLGKFSPRLC